jgi:Fe-S-cluster containining protein
VTFELPVLAPSPGDFAFACNRCGRCCTNREGRVRVAEEEVAGLAGALGLEPAAFARRYLRSSDGGLTLREDAGRCSLLTDANECSAYAARPAQCREFPFWESILTDREAFAEARDRCPGVFEVPRPAARRRAYAALKAFYVKADAEIARLQPRCQLSGDCCDFPKYGHRLFATLLEVDFAAEHGARLGEPEGADWCEFYRGRRCQAREVRPLACRTFYCDAAAGEALRELHERLLAELRAAETEMAYPQGYGDFVELLPARRAAIRLLDAARGDVSTLD